MLGKELFRKNYRFDLLMADPLTHPNCTPGLACSVLATAGRRVREIAAERTTDGDVLDFLLSDPNGRVRLAALARLERE